MASSTQDTRQGQDTELDPHLQSASIMGPLSESINQEQTMKYISHLQLASTIDTLSDSTNQIPDLNHNPHQKVTFIADTMTPSIDQEDFSSSPLSSAPSPASSSSLSSLGSSPSTPEYFCYSPVHSHELSVEMPSETTGQPINDNDPNPRPAKKRRTTEPKERTTQYLDLRPRSEASLGNQQSQLDTLMRALRKRRKIVVIAGAGISVSAGSRCFRLLPIHGKLNMNSPRLSIIDWSLQYLKNSA